MSSFAQARADVASAMEKLAALDRVFGMMDEFAARLAGIGQHPELGYDAATGRLTLAVVVGRVPPRVSLAVEEAVPALPAPGPSAAARKTLDPSLKTGPWTEEELDLAAELVGQGLTNKEVAARLNRPATGIHFKLDPLRKALAEEAQREAAEIPGETHGATTAEPACDMVADGGSQGSRLASGRTDDRSGTAATLAEGVEPAAGGSPAPEVAVPSVLAIEDCGDSSRDDPALPPSRVQRPADLTMAERHAWDLLDDIADPRWPASRDLDMLERMMRGDGAAATAEGMGAEKPAIVARWRRLFPGGVSIAQQERLVRVLKLRAAAEVAA